MKKISFYILGVLCYLHTQVCSAIEAFDVLPDLPEPLQAANASTVSGTVSNEIVNNPSIGHEPSPLVVILSLIFVVLLIYACGIIYTKLHKINAKTFALQQGELAKQRAVVISTTSLGNNKSVHVIELDGKRMLIGASPNSVQLIKDLGSYNASGEAEEYSHIEIPNIKIPKIEIPKIEIPSFNFAKMVTKPHKKNETVKTNAEKNTVEHVTENSDEIIDNLFTDSIDTNHSEFNSTGEHIVDPDDYALYKKYLG